MSNKFSGTIYGRWTVEGKTNPLWKWPSTCAMLAAFLSDDTQSSTDKKRAAEILQWIIEFRKSHDSDVIDFLLQLYLPSDIWNDDYRICEVVKEGVTRREWVCLREPSPYMSKGQSVPEQVASEPVDEES